MSYESFEKQFQWKTDPKTIKALEKMKKKEDAKKKIRRIKSIRNVSKQCIQIIKGGK